MTGSIFDVTGSFVLVAFMVIVTIVLLNLMVAKMTSTSNRIEDNVQKEWGCMQVFIGSQYS